MITLVTNQESGMNDMEDVTQKKKILLLSQSLSLGEVKGTARGCVHSAAQTFGKHVPRLACSD